MSGPSRDPRPTGPAAVRYRLEVRLSAADMGGRVVIRWRRPAGDSEQIADVLGVLTAADDASFTVRKASGELVAIPHDRVLAGKTVPPRRAATRKQEPGTGELLPGRPGTGPCRRAAGAGAARGAWSLATGSWCAGNLQPRRGTLAGVRSARKGTRP